MSTEQFIGGMQNIERSIIEKLRESGVNASGDNFLWHRGREVVPIPETISLEIRVQNRTANAVFAREHLEDSWDGINRPEVAATVDNLVRGLSVL